MVIVGRGMSVPVDTCHAKVLMGRYALELHLSTWYKTVAQSDLRYLGAQSVEVLYCYQSIPFNYMRLGVPPRSACFTTLLHVGQCVTLPSNPAS